MQYTELSKTFSYTTRDGFRDVRGWGLGDGGGGECGGGGVEGGGGGAGH